MGILDDVVINAKSAAEAVGKKAGQIMDVSKRASTPLNSTLKSASAIRLWVSMCMKAAGNSLQEMEKLLARWLKSMNWLPSMRLFQRNWETSRTK